MQQRGHNVFITSSIDKTIKVAVASCGWHIFLCCIPQSPLQVWDVSNIFEVVHPLDRMELRVDKVGYGML